MNWIGLHLKARPPIRGSKNTFFENFDLKVSGAYIAQIKRKCGLDVGSHYNPISIGKCPPLHLPSGKRASHSLCAEASIDGLSE